MVKWGLPVCKALVITLDTHRLGFEVLSRFQEAKRKSIRESGVEHVMQSVEVKTLCVSCLTTHNDGRAHELGRYGTHTEGVQAVAIPVLEWTDVPETHTMCTCTDSTRAQCVGDKHLVDIEVVPIEGQIEALVKLPQELGSGSERMDICVYFSVMPA